MAEGILEERIKNVDERLERIERILFGNSNPGESIISRLARMEERMNRMNEKIDALSRWVKTALMIISGFLGAVLTVLGHLLS